MTARSLCASVVDWGRMVKLSHTVFALPFALASAALATLEYGVQPARWPWIVLSMFAARNAAMGFNRLVDQEFDALNPRTAGRELPSGRLGRGTVWLLTGALTALFDYATFRLGLLWFAPIVLLAIFGYSWTKRFTWASHLALGVALGLAPIGAWLALAGHLSLTPILLGCGVACWVAGFDLIYACQDVDFDRGAGLQSLPARFGIRRALWTSRALHAATIGLLAAVGLRVGMHPLYWIGIVAVAAILCLEHRWVRADDLSRLNVAFFNLNASVSVVYLAGVLAALGVAALGAA